MNRVAKLGAVGLSLFGLLNIAHAQSAGTLDVSTGWLHLDSRVGTGPLVLMNPPLGAESNTGAVADNPNTLGAAITYFVTDHIATETWLGIPPKINFEGTGTLSSPAINPVATGRFWSPMLLFKYYLGKPGWKFRPYVGIGVAYNFVTDARLNQTFQDSASLQFTQGTNASMPSTAHFKPAWAGAFNVGVNYNIGKHWYLTASLLYETSSTEATITTHLPATNIITQVKIHSDPLITFLGAGYHF